MALNRKEMFNVSDTTEGFPKVHGYLFNVNGNINGIPSCILQ